jgi:hypothetical protein
MEQPRDAQIKRPEAVHKDSGLWVHGRVSLGSIR